MRITSFRKISVTERFSKVKFKFTKSSPIQTIRCSSSFTSITVVKHIERNVFESSEHPPNARNAKQKVLKLDTTRLSDQGPIATVIACLSDQSSVLSTMLRVPTLFHPKTQSLISQMSKLVPKVVYMYRYIKRHSKLHKT